MARPAILICVGATKAGTSWLYRALHDHPDCRMPAVKEAHYFDTFDTHLRERQVAAYRAQRDRLRQARAAATEGWQIANLDRRVADMDALLAVLTGDRTGDAGYRAWLTGRGEGARVVGELTPGYGTLGAEWLARIGALADHVVYLMRDPLARLWSHVRMQAQRQKTEAEDLETKANATLWRILNRGAETHVLARGDYPATVARLRAAVPEGKLRVAFCEGLFAGAGWAAMCRWLGIAERPADGAPAHEGPKVALRPDLAVQAVAFLKDHYDWAAREFGELPPEWRASLARRAA